MKIHKKIIAFGLILTFVMGFVEIDQIIEGSSEIIYNGHEYKLFTLSKTWDKAKADCEAQGGHLVTISSKGENDFVINLAGSYNVWIGFTDETNEGDWQWVTDESVIYTNWGSGEPNDAGDGEDYAVMGTNGLWNDEFNHGEYYVCEWESEDERVTYNGHAYKLFTISKTWDKAKADCEAQGGYLVTISSKEENDFVSNLAGSQNIWIGLTDEIHEGSWQWVNGEGLIYTKWDSEEPNDSGAGEDYAMMYDNGLWNDAGPPGSPEEAYAYVCEWEEGDTYSGLVLHLPMDEGSGTIVFDQSGNNNHGTIHGANWTTSGKSGDALEFDGQDDCIEVNPPPDLSTRLYTISTWTFFDEAPDPTEEWRYGIICQDDFETRVIQLNTYGDMFTLHRFGLDRDLFSYNTTIEAHRWYHVAVTFEGNYYRLYVDGVINDEQTGSFTPNNTLSLIIGAHNPDDYPFDGIIDEVRIYNRSLTMNEIKQLASGDGQDTTSTSESKTSTTFESQSIPSITPGFQLFSCIFILPTFILIPKIIRISKEVRK